MSWLFGILFTLTLAGWLRRERMFKRGKRHLELKLDSLASGKPQPGKLEGPMAELNRPINFIEEALEHLGLQRRLSEANLRIILDSMQDGVMVTDSRRVIRLVNPSLRKLVNLPEDTLGRPVLEALREPDADKLIENALKSGTPAERDLDFTRSGDNILLAVTVTPMRDASGEMGVLALFRDVTRLTKLERVRRDFVANVSHELRTPLAIFQGWVENLQDNPDMPREDQSVAFNVLQKHSKRLNALVEDLLTLARLESNHEELDLQPLNVPEFLSELARDWSTRTAAKQVSLKLDISGAVSDIPADRMRLEQVFTNLLENAFKYSPEGGTITISAAPDGRFVKLSVKDQGPGILSAELPHIFERFYRADKARSRERGGTGLGLSIVKHIVKSHRGEVSAESQYGSGTTIYVRLPVEEK